jgi:drug/metabolite transporter (DMT)-like permease
MGGNGSLVWAEQRMPSGLAAILLAMIPLWMVLLDSFRKSGPKLTLRVAGGLVIGLAGVGILVGPARLWGSSRVDLLGTTVLMFSAFCWAVGSLYSRGAKLPSSPFLAAAMEMLAGGAMLIILGLLVEGGQLHWRAISMQSAAGLLYLVAFGSLLGFTAYIWLLRVVSTSRVATYGYVNPVVAVFLGWALAGESISARELLAAGIIVAAVALILSHRPQPMPASPDTEGLPTIDEQRAMGMGE